MEEDYYMTPQMEKSFDNIDRIMRETQASMVASREKLKKMMIDMQEAMLASVADLQNRLQSHSRHTSHHIHQHTSPRSSQKELRNSSHHSQRRTESSSSSHTSHRSRHHHSPSHQQSRHARKSVGSEELDEQRRRRRTERRSTKTRSIDTQCSSPSLPRSLTESRKASPIAMNSHNKATRSIEEYPCSQVLLLNVSQPEPDSHQSTKKNQLKSSQSISKKLPEEEKKEQSTVTGGTEAGTIIPEINTELKQAATTSSENSEVDIVQSVNKFDSLRCKGATSMMGNENGLEGEFSRDPEYDISQTRESPQDNSEDSETYDGQRYELVLKRNLEYSEIFLGPEREKVVLLRGALAKQWGKTDLEMSISEGIVFNHSEIKTMSILKEKSIHSRMGNGVSFHSLGYLNGFRPNNKAKGDQRIDTFEQSICFLKDVSFSQECSLFKYMIAKLLAWNSSDFGLEWTDKFALGSNVEGQDYNIKEFAVVPEVRSIAARVFGSLIRERKEESWPDWGPWQLENLTLQECQLGGIKMNLDTAIQTAALKVFKLEHPVNSSSKPENDQKQVIADVGLLAICTSFSPESERIMDEVHGDAGSDFGISSTKCCLVFVLLLTSRDCALVKITWVLPLYITIHQRKMDFPFKKRAMAERLWWRISMEADWWKDVGCTQSTAENGIVLLKSIMKINHNSEEQIKMDVQDMNTNSATVVSVIAQKSMKTSMYMENLKSAETYVSWKVQVLKLQSHQPIKYWEGRGARKKKEKILVVSFRPP